MMYKHVRGMAIHLFDKCELTLIGVSNVQVGEDVDATLAQIFQEEAVLA